MELGQKSIEAERKNDDVGPVTVFTKKKFMKLQKAFVHMLMQTMVCGSAIWHGKHSSLLMFTRAKCVLL